jgi:hypothetical protein
MSATSLGRVNTVREKFKGHNYHGGRGHAVFGFCLTASNKSIYSLYRISADWRKLSSVASDWALAASKMEQNSRKSVK